MTESNHTTPFPVRESVREPVRESVRESAQHPRTLTELTAQRTWLFDLDGTLVDTLPDIAAALNRLLVRQGCAAVPVTHVRDWVGTGSRTLIATALGAQGRTASAAELDALLVEYAADYERHAVVESRLYPGAEALLAALRERQVRLAIVTNKLSAIAREVLAGVGIAQHFELVVGFDDVPVGKPDPASLLLAARRLATPAADCLFIGDSRNDVAAARAANMPVVAVSHGYNHGEPISSAAPDLVVDSLRALL